MASEVLRILASGELATVSWSVLDGDSQCVPTCGPAYPYTPGPGTLPEEPGSTVTQHAPVEFALLTEPQAPGPLALRGHGLPTPSRPSSWASGSPDSTPDTGQ